MYADALDSILNLMSVFHPFEIRRSLFHWTVGHYYSGFFDSWFDVTRRFWTKRAATAELVRLALTGAKVKL